MEADTLVTWNNLQTDLKNFVYRKVKDRALAADIVQDVFLKVQSNHSQLKDKTKLSAWIYRITQHVVMDHFRKSPTPIKAIDIDWEFTT